MDKLITPKRIIDKLPQFDLDVCAPVERPWETAKNYYTIDEDGLNKEWKGLVFCNPIGSDSYDWLLKCAKHSNCIALTFAKTDTKQYSEIVFRYATSIIWLKGRVRYCYSNGKNASATMLPSVLLSFNQDTGLALEKSGISGKHMWLKRYSKPFYTGDDFEF